MEERSKITHAEERVKKPVTLVFFLGGVTYAEISALRYLSERDNASREYMVATTQLLNGDTMLTEVMEKIENNLRRSTLRAEFANTKK